MNSIWTYVAFILVGMAYVTVMTLDDREPMTEQQQRAAWNQQQVSDPAYRESLK